jgi:predicted Zn-dependent protease
MLTLAQMREFASSAAAMLVREHDLAAFEVYCSSSEQLVVRLNYTSDIPCRGLEEAKSESANGLALRIVSSRNPRECGHAFEAGEPNQLALRRALERARARWFLDPHFPGLPRPKRAPKARVPRATSAMRVEGKVLVRAGWDALYNAVGRFARYAKTQADGHGFILGGDITLSKERVAIAGSHIPRAGVDQHAHFRLNLTAFVEAVGAKASVGFLGTSARELRLTAPQLGVRVVDEALKLSAGQRPEPGQYRVLLGPQPVAEILNHIVMPSLSARSFRAGSSAYLGRFAKAVMDRRLSLVDDPRAPWGVLRRSISCEGIPTGRTILVRDGKLSGLLASFYDAAQLAADPDRERKLSGVRGRKRNQGNGEIAPGRDNRNRAAGFARFAGANGYRLADSGVRRFDAQIATAASNVALRARQGRDLRALMRLIGNGLYVGNVWYTYPVNGQAAGDFTCTITGSSYLIRDGAPAGAIAPNCLRINANICDVFEALIAPEAELHAIALWGAPQAYYVPALAVERVSLDAIAPPHTA